MPPPTTITGALLTPCLLTGSRSALATPRRTLPSAPGACSRRPPRVEIASVVVPAGIRRRPAVPEAVGMERREQRIAPEPGDLAGGELRRDRRQQQAATAPAGQRVEPRHVGLHPDQRRPVRRQLVAARPPPDPVAAPQDRP